VQYLEGKNEMIFRGSTNSNRVLDRTVSLSSEVRQTL